LGSIAAHGDGILMNLNAKSCHTTGVTLDNAQSNESPLPQNQMNYDRAVQCSDDVNVCRLAFKITLDFYIT
jgi:hypothetical protein